MRYTVGKHLGLSGLNEIHFRQEAYVSLGMRFLFLFCEGGEGGGSGGGRL